MKSECVILVLALSATIIVTYAVTIICLPRKSHHKLLSTVIIRPIIRKPHIICKVILVFHVSSWYTISYPASLKDFLPCFTLSRGHTSGPGAIDCVFPVTSGPYTSGINVMWMFFLCMFSRLLNILTVSDSTTFAGNFSMYSWMQFRDVIQHGNIDFSERRQFVIFSYNPSILSSIYLQFITNHHQ